MGFDDKSPEMIFMEPVGTPPAGEVISDAEQASIVQQTRTRRLFSTAQLFAFSLVFQGTWFAVAGNVYYAIQNGGPRGWLFGYLVVICGTLCQVATFAEMASIQPIAGAQYYWTYHFAPAPVRNFLTWMQGWTTWLGYLALLASVTNNTAVTIEGIAALASPGWTPEGWLTTIIFIGYILLITLINMYSFRLVPWLELVAGVVNVLLFFVCLILLWVMAPRNSINIFLQKSTASGWGDFMSFNIGSLSAIYLFIAFESTVHMGEETRNPKRAVPSSMFWGTATSCAMGLIMVFTYGIALPPTEVILESVSPLAAIFNHATGSANAAMAILICLVIISTGSLVGTLSSVSRLTWAWARDGGLPKYFAFVDARTRVPARAVWFTAFLVSLLSLLNLNNQAFIALGAILSLSSLGVYVSYVIVLGCILHARLTTPGGIQMGEWNVGRTGGLVVNVVGLVFTIYECIWLPFPNVLPVTAANMNYAGPIFGGVMLGVISWWFLWAKHRWAGPNLKVVQIVLRNDAESK